jgi:hypothetical protein
MVSQLPCPWFDELTIRMDELDKHSGWKGSGWLDAWMDRYR